MCGSIAFMLRASPQDLSLWNQQLGHVPDGVWQRTDLETLVLAGNRLTQVSERIGSLRKLRMLDLGHNQLATVPAALGDLEGLTDFLYLNDNRLTSLHRFNEPSDQVALPKHQWKQIVVSAGSGLQYGWPDRASRL